MNEQKKIGEGTEIDLKRLFDAVWHRAWVILVVSILCAVLAGVGTEILIPKQYQASAKFYVNNNALSIGGVGISSSDLSASQELVDTYIVILNTRDTLEEVIRQAGLDQEGWSYSKIKPMISAAAVNNTEIFEVVVTSEDRDLSLLIAETIVDVLPVMVSNTIESATSVKPVEHPVRAGYHSYPSPAQNTILGMVIGLVLMVAFVVLREIFDVTIRTEEDIQRSCKYPLLAKVPDMASHHRGGYYRYGRYYGNYGYGAYAKVDKKDKKTKKGAAEPKEVITVGSGISFAASEAYKHLRTKVQFSFTETGCHVLGVSSAMAGEGKSLTSTNLAYSLTQLNKRVLLIDCDMRRPSLAEKLKIEKHPGLSNYLTGHATMAEAIQYVKLDLESPMHVITAGRNPPNPMELLSSEKMERAVAELKESYDYIILDLPPVGEVGDAMAVAKLTDGILLVSCQDYGTRVALNNAMNQFEFIEAKILGVVLNRASDGKRSYGYRYYYRRYYKQYGYYSRYKSYESSYMDAVQDSNASGQVEQ